MCVGGERRAELELTSIYFSVSDETLPPTHGQALTERQPVHEWPRMTEEVSFLNWDLNF